ncbi:hypothetical protein QRX60_11410 [Amycolatopsis mongoliensis]|uniref:Uncharacterized protein n=1 Tax=Amycolatopsis mongoliensis TaxID=715475 RepID=A0A9Y2JWT7_9PSEU|nr:hypothetical protein [Amycolatopsis sp. 4-36]WIY04414.1 hypothetical protein QRX60_11410 [Amycolatopsis sp. 4-36]
MADDQHCDDEQPEDPSGEDRGPELTPEQQEELKKSTDDIWRSLAPKFDLKLPRIPNLIPDSVLKNFTALSAFAEAQQAIVSNAIKPLLDSQAAWQKQFSVINSDIFKNVALQQSTLNNVASQLAKNVNFGLSDTVNKAASQFAIQQVSWLKDIAPALANIRASFYPKNLQGIEGLEFEQVEEVVMVDGIPLYGVPRTSTALALIRAESVSKRREILGRRWKTISADCREVATACTESTVATYVPFAIAALDALDAGHTEAAQALAGSLVDSIIRAYFKKDRVKFTPDKKGKRTKDAYNDFTIRQFIAFAPMWQMYQQFWVEDGDVVPIVFNRNATAHTVSTRQYNRRNTVQASMVACSLLCRINEEVNMQKVA